MCRLFAATEPHFPRKRIEMAETVLVTGGSGFVAGWCIVELLNRGYIVRTTVRDASKAAGIAAAAAAGGAVTDRLTAVVANLLDDDGWDAAVEGCKYVLHVASPLGGGAPGDRHGLVAPARDGTLRVLRAAVRAGVTRVVMTSAAAAARPPLESNRASDETIWADPDDPQFDAYRVSKILAERAAWDFIHREGGSTSLTTILPGAVFGPILTRDNRGSVQIIQGLLDGRPPATPKLGFWIVDVRDLAELHVRAMTSPAAAGERFLAAGDFMWMAEMAAALRHALGEQARRVPRWQLPTALVHLLLPVTPHLRGLAPLLGRKFLLTSEKARRMLGINFRSGAATVADCARSLDSVNPPAARRA
jgi:nucleoside-diphosphate-sugar epimerase